MSALTFGPYQKRVDGATSPWDVDPPPPKDDVCTVCQCGFEDFEIADPLKYIEWPKCGHFGHKACLQHLAICPECKEPLGHDATPHEDAAMMEAQTEAMEAEEAVRMDLRMRGDIELARRDVSFWNILTEDERGAYFYYVQTHPDVLPLPYERIEGLMANGLLRSTWNVEYEVRDLTIAEVSLISNALKHNTRVKHLRLGLFDVGLFDDEGARCAAMLADMLRVNTHMRICCLSDGNIGPVGVKHFADALLVNHTLHRLRLENCKIGDEGAVHIADALLVNKTLRGLSVMDDPINNDGAESMAKVLLTNTSLRVIDFSKNSIETQGALALAKALTQNKTMIRLNLSFNSIGSDGFTRLGESLVSSANKFMRMDLWENDDTEPCSKYYLNDHFRTALNRPEYERLRTFDPHDVHVMERPPPRFMDRTKLDDDYSDSDEDDVYADEKIRLHHHAKHGRLESVLACIIRGDDVNKTRETDRSDTPTPLRIACAMGHGHVVKALLEHHANVNLQNKGYGVTALMCAVAICDVKTVELLLDNGAKVDMTAGEEWDISGKTALMYAATFTNDVKVISVLLDRGADVDKHDSRGMTALAYAYRRHLSPYDCTTSRSIADLIEGAMEKSKLKRKRNEAST